MYYSMTLIWSTYVKFIFNEWSTQDSMVGFIIGCFITFLLAVFAMALPKIRSKIEKTLFSYQKNDSVNDEYYQELEPRSKEEIRMTPREIIVKKWVIPFFYSLLYSVLHVGIMLVMMSMNAYVILAIIVGYTLGFLVFSDSCRLKKGKECAGGCHTKV